MEGYHHQGETEVLQTRGEHLLNETDLTIRQSGTLPNTNQGLPVLSIYEDILLGTLQEKNVPFSVISNDVIIGDKLLTHHQLDLDNPTMSVVPKHRDCSDAAVLAGQHCDRPNNKAHTVSERKRQFFFTVRR